MQMQSTELRSFLVRSGRKDFRRVWFSAFPSDEKLLDCIRGKHTDRPLKFEILFLPRNVLLIPSSAAVTERGERLLTNEECKLQVDDTCEEHPRRSHLPERRLKANSNAVFIFTARIA
jgi:hypothetical protein